MGLNEAIARQAVRGAHVLIVEVPGWAETRMRVEAETTRRGWHIAMSAADADILVVCGAPGAELRTVCDRVWDQVPGPRERVTVDASDSVEEVLDRCASGLADDVRQRQDARVRVGSGAERSADGDTGHATDRGGASDTNHADIGHADMDHAGHAGMDHGDMEMMPGGIPLAGGGDDRDGLEMDVLHVPLGPVLPNWPAGLVIDCVMQGDVVVSASARVLAPAAPATGDPGRSPTEMPRDRVIRFSDLAARLLDVAGWQHAATRARRLRDTALAGTGLGDIAPALERLRARVDRSLLLRWSLRGIASGPGTGASAHDPARDLRDRLTGWLGEAADLAAESSGPERSSGGSAGAVVSTNSGLDNGGTAEDGLVDDPMAVLAEMLAGVDLGTASLLVAGAGLDTAAIARSHYQHGEHDHGEHDHAQHQHRHHPTDLPANQSDRDE